MESAWRWYRLMSFVCGTTLILLYIVLIVQLASSKHFQNEPVFSALARIVGVGHGVVMFPIYLVTAGLFAIRARVHLGTLAAMILAGFVPGLAFYMEHRVGIQYGMIKETAS